MRSRGRPSIAKWGQQMIISKDVYRLCNSLREESDDVGWFTVGQKIYEER